MNENDIEVKVTNFNFSFNEKRPPADQFTFLAHGTIRTAQMSARFTVCKAASRSATIKFHGGLLLTDVPPEERKSLALAARSAAQVFVRRKVESLVQEFDWGMNKFKWEQPQS